MDWEVDLDGSNIEIATTRPLATAEEVTTIVGEMSGFAGNVQAGKILSVNGTVFTIGEGDNSGQPQVNFDISTTGIAEQLPQIPANNFARLFSARLAEGDIKNFGWTPDKTQRQTNAIAEIPGIYAGIADALNARIADKFKAGKLGTPTPDLLAKVADAFFIAASQVVQHIASEGLTKDVPILIKTSFIAVVDKIAAKTQPADDESIAADHWFDRDERMAKALRAAISEFVVPATVRAFNTINGPPEERGGDGKKERSDAQLGMDLLDGNGSLRGGGKEPADMEDSLGVLIELRRAPVIPIADWVPFAVDAFQTVGQLLTLPEDEDSVS